MAETRCRQVQSRGRDETRRAEQREDETRRAEQRERVQSDEQREEQRRKGAEQKLGAKALRHKA